MSSKEVTITVYENNDPLVLVSLKRPDGYAYDLTGVTELEFLMKRRRGDARADAIAIYTLSGGAIAITDTTGGIVSIQFSAAHLADTGHFPFHLDEIRGVDPNAKRLTLVRGKVVVENT